MAKRDRAQASADLSEALRLGAVMKELPRQLNTDRHLNAVTKAGYEILAEAFNTDMHMAAATPAGTLLYHHVYEWEHVGEPGFQLWKLNLSGRGGSRSISWNWKASMTTVPTTTNVNGTDKFLPSPGFDPKRLHRVHIFHWKAPVMEYGITVTVRPRLSHVLVYPNNQQQGAGGRMGPGLATFSPHPEIITPGAQVQGNFTAFFLGFFSTRADDILDQTFVKQRNNNFAHAFHQHLSTARKTRSTGKVATFTPNAAAAREGKNIARAIASDGERNYYKMAAGRKRRPGGESDDEV